MSIIVGDVVILHDPQPLGMSKTLRHLLGDDIYIVFRSRKNPAIVVLCVC